MKVLAIDPGYDRLGIAILEGGPNKSTLIYSTCIITKREDDLPKRLLTIGTALRELIGIYSPDAVAIEGLFFNRNVKTAIAVAEARGVLLFIAKEAGRPIYEFSPSTIKLSTTGYGNSDKTAVIVMVKRLVNNVPEGALDDEYDAIAIGVTCLAHHGRGR